MRKTILTILVVGLFFSLSGVSYAQNQFMDIYRTTFQSSAGTTGNDILDIFRSIAGYLMIFGGILAGIAIITSGLMYMGAGSNPARVTSAKAIFKNGALGALILFAAGLIVNTIILFAVNWQTFFS